MISQLRSQSRDETTLMVKAIEQSWEAVALADTTGHFVYVNRAFCHLSGYSPEELEGRDMSLLTPASENQKAHRGCPETAPVTPSGERARLLRVKTKDGHEIPVMVTTTPLTTEIGGWIGSATWIRNLSDESMTGFHLLPAANVFENAYDGVIITDAEANIIDVNPAFTRITGYRREEVLGKNPRILQSGRQGKEFYGVMWERLLQTGYFRGDVWNRRKDASLYAQLLTILAVRDQAGVTRQYLGILNDITDLKTQARELERLAYQDSLTGLPNRLLLADRLSQAVGQSRRIGKPFAVCFLDLDGFKAINDTYGHHVGDEVLIAISRRLGQCIRDGDTIARLGGDEFVLVLTNLEGRNECERTLRRLVTVASDPVKVGTLELPVSMSMGVALFPVDSEDPDILLSCADESMYRAKHAGKNRYEFCPHSLAGNPGS